MRDKYDERELYMGRLAECARTVLPEVIDTPHNLRRLAIITKDPPYIAW